MVRNESKLDEPNQHTYELLARWHQGDGAALQEILRRDLPWIRSQVQRRLGDALRAKGETQDYVQDAMVEVLRYGPRFMLSDRRHFRALMCRIIENVLRGKAHWFHARRRQMAREKPLPPDTLLVLDADERSVTRPSQAAQRTEREAWVRMALELLSADDRELVLRRQWHDQSFVDIAKEMELSEDAARMRFNRAMPRLLGYIKQLQSGGIEDLLSE